jgi:hypothetical protein
MRAGYPAAAAGATPAFLLCFTLGASYVSRPKMPLRVNSECARRAGIAAVAMVKNFIKRLGGQTERTDAIASWAERLWPILGFGSVSATAGGGLAWMAERGPDIIVLMALAFCAISLVIANQLLKLRAPQQAAAPTTEALAQALLRQMPLDLLELQFGQPVQSAAEHYLSWWHVPVTMTGGTTGERIEQCSARLITSFTLLSTGPPSASLRWQTPDHEDGLSETTMIRGKTYLIPVVIRCERNQGVAANLGDGIARLTDLKFLRDKDYVNTQLKRGSYSFKLQVVSGERRWESPEYSIKLPDFDESNGHFVLERRG